MPPTKRKTPVREDRPDRNPGPKPWEPGLSLDEGVTWMIANEAGLDGRALARAGQAAQPVLRLLRAANQAHSVAQRKRLAQRTKAELERLNKDTRAELSEPVLARVEELTGKAEAPSTNPITGLQEFSAMPTEDQRSIGQRLSDWWQSKLPKRPTSGPFNPGAENTYTHEPIFGPSLLPKPFPSGKGLLPPTVQNVAATEDEAQDSSDPSVFTEPGIDVTDVIKGPLKSVLRADAWAKGELFGDSEPEQVTFTYSQVGSPTGESVMRDGQAIPVLKKEADRVQSIETDSPAVFRVAPSTEADPNAPWYSWGQLGNAFVDHLDDTIVEEGTSLGVDPDLIRSVIYLETAHGHYGPATPVAEILTRTPLGKFANKPSSLWPMNFDPQTWDGLGFSREEVLRAPLKIPGILCPSVVESV